MIVKIGLKYLNPQHYQFLFAHQYHHQILSYFTELFLIPSLSICFFLFYCFLLSLIYQSFIVLDPRITNITRALLNITTIIDIPSSLLRQFHPVTYFTSYLTLLNFLTRLLR
jgi:hypothetical protein